jgi:hypothetical protein
MNVLRKEHRLKVHKSRVLRRPFGPNREEMTVGWRKLHCEEFLSFIHSCETSLGKSLRWMRFVGNIAHVGEKINVYRVLVREPKGKRPLEGPVHRWEANIKMELQEIGYEVMYCIPVD